jgi:hypothetical protein
VLAKVTAKRGGVEIGRSLRPNVRNGQRFRTSKICRKFTIPSRRFFTC